MTRQTIGFALALCLFILFLFLPTPDSFLRTATQIIAEQHAQIDPAELARSMQTVLALSQLMIVLWLTEAIPLPATALLPAALLPPLHLRSVAHGTTVEFDFANVRFHCWNYCNVWSVDVRRARIVIFCF